MTGSFVGNRPGPALEAPRREPVNRTHIGLLNQLKDAGGTAMIGLHGALIVDDGRQQLSGQPQDWLRLLAYGLIEGGGDGRTIRLSEAGARTAAGHPGGVIRTSG